MSTIKIFTLISISVSILLMSCSNLTAQPLPSASIFPSISPTMQVEDFVNNLDIPWEIAFAQDGRIFVTERTGKIIIIENGIIQPEPWIMLPVAAVGEGGLLGMALDPDFSNNHYLYVTYTYQDSTGSLKNQLARLVENVSTKKGVLDKVILDNAAGGGNHDGGRVKIGPDGKLYWTLGETNNPTLSQDLNSWNGKILRVNLNGSIPSDNPFPNSPIYSYGHRNPEGIAWQTGTNRLYSTEHGPSGGIYGVGQDEVNYIQPGQNYGWPTIHGDQSQPGMVSPIIQSGTNETWAPSGCTFVKGGPWDGSFVFAGLAGQTLYRLTLDPTNPSRVATFERLLAQQYGRLRNVTQGPDGALYILTNNTDGRGNPGSNDDRILKLTFK